VALGTAIIGFAASKDGDARFALLAVLPVMLFWLLDAYYLALERSYRALFNRERVRTDEPPSFDLNPGSIGPADYAQAAWRFAVWSIHLPVLVLAVVVAGYGFLHHSLAVVAGK
jgi:hypothetical protein